MSAFVVDNLIINRIVAGIDYAKINNELNGPPRPYQEILIDSEPDQLGLALRELNEGAVKQRYPDWITSGLPGTYEGGQLQPYRYEWTPYPPIMQLYKDLACLIYQCTEGDIPSDPLYKQLKDYYNDLAHTIIHRLPDFEKAEWG